MNDTVMLLSHAKGIIANGHWTQYRGSDEKSARFCGLGALGHVACIRRMEYSDGFAYDYLFKAANRLYGQGVSYVNDTLGLEAILHVYDEAIRDAKADASVPKPTGLPNCDG